MKEYHKYGVQYGTGTQPLLEDAEYFGRVTAAYMRGKRVNEWMAVNSAKKAAHAVALIEEEREEERQR